MKKRFIPLFTTLDRKKERGERTTENKRECERERERKGKKDERKKASTERGKIP